MPARKTKSKRTKATKTTSRRPRVTKTMSERPKANKAKRKRTYGRVPGTLDPMNTRVQVPGTRDQNVIKDPKRLRPRKDQEWWV